MKIVYLGNFKSGFSTETYIADALERAGVEVVRLQKVETWSNTIKYECRDADFLLFPKLNHPIPQVKCPTVCWIFDLFFDLPKPFDRKVDDLPYFKADIVISTDAGHDAEWEKRGIKHYCIRQGVDKVGKYAVEPNFETNTAFIGSLSYPYRADLVNLVKKYKGWFIQEGYYAHNLNHLLSKIRIVVGDSVPSPFYWSNRVYEITGRGGFIIHPYVEGIKEEFPDLVTYEHGNIEELQEKIEYYLHNEAEREDIKQKCHKVCPTYDDRVQEFLCILQKH